MTSGGTWSRDTHWGLAAATCIARPLTSSWNCSVRATKSVSQFTSMRTPSLAPAWMYELTTPSRASRWARFEAAARPFLRRKSTACSMSSLEAASASLQSITPAPVLSRSSRTFSAVVAIVLQLLLVTCPNGPANAARQPLLRRPDALGGPRRRSGAGGLLRLGRLHPIPGGRRRFNHRGHRVGLGAHLGRHPAPFDHRVRDAGGDEPDRPDRVVVAGNRIVDPARIAVRVDDRDDRDLELLSLGHRDPLLARIDDVHRRGQALHQLDPEEGLLELPALAVQPGRLLLRDALELPRVAHVLEALQVIDRLADRREVRERAAQPPLVHVEHPAAGGLVGDGLLRLLLRADEQDRPPGGRQVAREPLRVPELLEGLLQVDDVDAVPLPEDVLRHLRVPALGLVAEVDPGLEEFLHGDLCHRGIPPVGLPPRSLRPPIVPPAATDLGARVWWFSSFRCLS